MALQRTLRFPKMELLFKSQKLQPNELMSLIRITTRMKGPITETIRGDFRPKVKGKVKELLEMSAKETTL